MTGVEALVKTSELNLHRLAKLAHTQQALPYFRYDPVLDEVIFLVVPPGSDIVGHYLDDHVALLYDPETMDVVGLEVEDFVESFLPKYASVSKVWKLSDWCKGAKDFGDVQIKVEMWEPVVAAEVIRVADSILGGPIGRLQPALA